MKALSIIICWCLAQAETSCTTYLYVEVVDLGCIHFVSPGEYGMIMVREFKILICKCLLKKLYIDGFI
jgi:hypothetical protein